MKLLTWLTNRQKPQPSEEAEKAQVLKRQERIRKTLALLGAEVEVLRATQNLPRRQQT